MQPIIITLSNGTRVGNFSSPHSFKFTDGSVLPAVEPSESLRLKVTFIEEVDEDGDVSLTFDLSEDVIREIENWTFTDDVDKVLIPLPMMTALKEKGFDIKNSPFRCVRIEDRVKKLVSISKFCI